MAANGNQKGAGEAVQILIYVLFMTAAGFALFSAVLFFFLVPGKADEVNDQLADAKKLTDFLSPKNNAKTGMWDLRSRMREAKKAHGDQSLKEIVQGDLGGL